MFRIPWKTLTTPHLKTVMKTLCSVDQPAQQRVDILAEKARAEHAGGDHADGHIVQVRVEGAGEGPEQIAQGRHNQGGQGSAAGRAGTEGRRRVLPLRSGRIAILHCVAPLRQTVNSWIV